MDLRNALQEKDLDGHRGNRLEPLVTEQELSAITGRSLGSIRRDRRLGQGCPYIKLGALVRYRPQDVRTYLENNLRCRGGK